MEGKPAKVNLTEFLKSELNINDVQITLLKHFLSKDEFLNSTSLAQNIKRFKLNIVGFAPIDEAISTVGGISLSEIDDFFS